MKIVCTNRKAKADYFILETIEAGLVLQGTEVKSLREGKANLKGSFARIEEGEAYLYDSHISSYGPGSRYNPDPMRKRKLLLHKSEINRLSGKVSEKGLTLIPLSLYFKEGKAKVELALARGKKEYDKRERIKKKIMEQELERVVRGR